MARRCYDAHTGAAGHGRRDCDSEVMPVEAKIPTRMGDGFLVRMKTRAGRAIISARRAKGRKRLAV